MCVCKMGNLTSLYAPPEAWTRDWPSRASAGAAGTRSTTSCKRCLTSQTARGCFTCASLRGALLSATCRYSAEALLWFAAGSSATTASKTFPDFRARCSGCVPAAAALLCSCRVPRWGSAPDGFTWRTCSEASNNAIAGFRTDNANLIVDGLRVLCAPQPRAAAAAAVASGSGSLHSDLRDNKLKEFEVEEFLAKALQLETLYAAANACALHAHRMIGRRAGSPAATRCTAARARSIADEM